MYREEISPNKTTESAEETEKKSIELLKQT